MLDQFLTEVLDVRPDNVLHFAHAYFQDDAAVRTKVDAYSPASRANINAIIGRDKKAT